MNLLWLSDLLGAWEDAGNSDGEFVEAFIATILNFAAETTLYDVAVTTLCALLLLAIVYMVLEHLSLLERHKATEADLFDRTIGKQSTNWANAAQNLERKAKDPGDVARSTAMTHLYMLDEAANAWLKGSQWAEALRVTQEFLRECCHTISKPSIHEDDFRAASDLIELRLGTYPDLSKAANEATENAVTFLNALDTMLSIVPNNPRVEQLRERVTTARTTVEAKPPAPKPRPTLFARLRPALNSQTP